MSKGTVYSLYNPNVSSVVAKAQKACVERFLPEGWRFEQILHEKSHGEMMGECVEQNKEEYTVFLDIDCIPLSPVAFSYFLDSRWSIKDGALMGAAQRANHIKNNAHVYVGPFCMAFKNSTYRELGSPTFVESYRGDVGEELTYRWQEKNRPVFYIYPSDVEQPLWDLIPNVPFGIGTTYENLFYHAFQIRGAGQPQIRFIKKCKEVVDTFDSSTKAREAVAE